MPIDITQLPPPPSQSGQSGSGFDINSLPAPPPTQSDDSSEGSSLDVSALPAPPKSPETHENPQFLQDQDFQEIAARHGVSPDELKQIAPYYGVQEEPSGGLSGAASQAGKYTAGAAGRMLLGVPQFVYKKLQDAPMRRAIDELTGIGEEQRSPVESAAEMVALPGGGASGAEKAATGLAASAGRVAKAAGIGAGIGAVNAPEGQELQGARKGLIFGSVLGTGGEVLGAALRTVVGESSYRNAELKLQKEVDALATRTQDSEAALADSVLNGRDIPTESAGTVVEQQIPREVAEDVTNPDTEIGDFKKTVQTEQGITPNPDALQEQAQSVADSRATKFANALNGEKLGPEEARAEIQKTIQRQGDQAVREAYQDFVQREQALRVIDEQGSRISGKTGAGGKLANFFSGNQQVLRHLDDKFGLTGQLSTENALQNATTRNNQMGYATVNFRSALDKIDKTAEKLGVRNSSNITKALDTGDFTGLSPEEGQIAEMFQSYYKSLLDFSNGAAGEFPKGLAPLNIKPQVNEAGQISYVPHTLKDANQVIIEANHKMEQALSDMSQKFGRPIQDISELSPQEYRMAVNNDSNLKDIKDALTLFGDANVPRPADFSAAFKDRFSSRRSYASIETAARAAQERQGGIPEWMREQDPYKLAAKSTMNSLRHLFMRRPIQQMQNIADVIEKAGGDYESRYLRRIGEDYLGTRSSTFNIPAFTNQARIDFVRSMDRAIQKFGPDTVTGKSLEAVKAVPDIMASWARSIFPNVLGYRIRPLMMHATQSAAKLWPELGTSPYGAYTVLRGATKAALNAERLLSYGEEIGIIPDQALMQRSSALRTGIEKSALYRIPANTVNGINSAGMFAFEKLVRFNRAIAIGTANTIAEDLVAGSAQAQKTLSRFPRSVQNLVNAGMTAEEKTQPLARYLNAQAMYNFDKLNKSEFGRTMGPLFSAFSTWPTNTLGDIVYEMRSRGAVGSIPRQLERYVAPWALLYAVDKAIRAGSHGDLTPREKVVFGSAGLSSMAPIGALGALAKGEALTPPMYTVLMQTLIHPMMSGDLDKGKSKAYKGLADALASYGPNAGLVQFVTDQVPTLLTGHRPEGNNFIERTQEGSRQLKRIAK